MLVEELAADLSRLALVPPDLVNAYLIGGVLIDTGGRLARRRLFAALEGRTVTAHTVTHAHFDHQGSSHAVCERLDIPLWCGAGDREALESGDLARVLPRGRPLFRWIARRAGGPAHPVARVLKEGDDVGGFAVLEVPGHTPGSLAFWRQSDGALVLGDVLFNRNPVTRRRGLAEPFRIPTWDRAANLGAARRLAALKPRLICFGHGAPLRDTQRFCDFVATLPDR